MARLKLFTGIDVGGVIRGKAATLQQRLSDSGANVNWAAAENFHITLNFLGDVDDRDLHGICRAVADVAKTEPPFRLGISGVGAFPTPRRPKIVWAAITDGLDVLQRIHAAAEPKLTALGVYRREERGYTPHLTLGRVKDETDGNLIAAELPKYAEWNGGDTYVQEILVYSSDLRRDGPVYSVIGRAALSGR
ncbi:RNA 2',3'-cyclic phosphodiesterase [Limnoglobus roseus]|uniref:RNA 2',3'-cyclic phosphodiesterase n=1 Tax=Limnoglobus roseus TaxID=2598579 RepID=A0A5C1AK00_9BACT|nr:RNA 2',3'-cyclic phosphodiesterase [Limnoglobus roseus]QEL18346.1 RNA 2',3'-cyclic phosphodiesterase [Limnoglobus roseus]